MLYTMRGYDTGLLTHVYWSVYGTPDFAGTYAPPEALDLDVASIAVATKRGNVAVYDTYQKLHTAMTGSSTLNEAALVNRTSGAKIGVWRKFSYGIRPVGPVTLSAVTASKQGVIASGGPLTFAVTAGHNLPASGTCHVLDVSAGVSLTVSPVSFTCSGDNVTLGSSVEGTAAGDHIVVVGVSEFDPGIDWFLHASALGGLSFKFDNAAIMTNGFMRLHIMDPHDVRFFSVHSRMTMSSATNATGSKSGVGIYEDSTHCHIGGCRRGSSVWTHGFMYASLPTPSEGNAGGTITTLANIRGSRTGQTGSTGAVADSVDRFGMCTSDNLSGVVGSAGNLGASVSPYTLCDRAAAFVICAQRGTGDTIVTTVTEVGYEPHELI